MPLPQEDGPLSRLSFPLLFTPFIPRLPPLLCASLLPFPHLTLSSTQGLHLLKGRRLLQPFIQEGLNLLEPVVHEQVGFIQETEVLSKRVHHRVLPISLKIRDTKGTFHAKIGTIKDKAVWT